MMNRKPLLIAMLLLLLGAACANQAEPPMADATTSTIIEVFRAPT